MPIAYRSNRSRVTGDSPSGYLYPMNLDSDYA